VLGRLPVDRFVQPVVIVRRQVYLDEPLAGISNPVSAVRVRERELHTRLGAHASPSSADFDLGMTGRELAQVKLIRVLPSAKQLRLLEGRLAIHHERDDHVAHGAWANRCRARSE